MPGIALSGYGTLSDILASRQAGFAMHLVKPITLALEAGDRQGHKNVAGVNEDQTPGSNLGR